MQVAAFLTYIIMFKPSATFHKSPQGDVSVLVCSEDSTVCLEAYKDCTEPGELVYMRKGHMDKFKQIKAAAVDVQPKPKRKRAKKVITQ